MIRRLLLAICLSGCVAFTTPSPASRQTDTEPPASQSSAHFEALQIFIDPHGHALAAYQFEVVAGEAEVQLVGIEGGEHPAFSEAPYYDPKALISNRVVVASFSTASNLPNDRTRVATLMVRVLGPKAPTYTVRLQAAASSDARPLDAQITSSGVLP